MELTIHLLMTKEEMLKTIGLKSVVIARVRNMTGALIELCDSGHPYCAVRISGTTDIIWKASKLICRNLEQNVGGAVAVRWLITESQYQILGFEYGCKMSGIRQITMVELAQKGVGFGTLLYRCTSVSGPSDCVANFIYLCCLLLEMRPMQVASSRLSPGAGGVPAGAPHQSQGPVSAAIHFFADGHFRSDFNFGSPRAPPSNAEGGEKVVRPPHSTTSNEERAEEVVRSPQPTPSSSNADRSEDSRRGEVRSRKKGVSKSVSRESLPRDSRNRSRSRSPICGKSSDKL